MSGAKNAHMMTKPDETKPPNRRLEAKGVATVIKSHRKLWILKWWVNAKVTTPKSIIDPPLIKTQPVAGSLKKRNRSPKPIWTGIPPSRTDVTEMIFPKRNSSLSFTSAPILETGNNTLCTKNWINSLSISYNTVSQIDLCNATSRYIWTNAVLINFITKMRSLLIKKWSLLVLENESFTRYLVGFCCRISLLAPGIKSILD